MACRATKVQKPALSEHEDGVAVWEGPHVILRLDVGADDAWNPGEAVGVDFVVEVADVADDCLVLHLLHVFDGDDVAVASACDEDVDIGDDFFDGPDLVTFHGSLESADWVDFCNNDPGTLAPEGLSAAFADITVAEDESGLATDHDICSPVDTVDEGVPAAVEVVELGLGDGVVDVDGWEEELAFLLELVEPVDTGGGFFTDALAAGDDVVPVLLVLGINVPQDAENFLEFFAVGGFVSWDGAGLFELEALVDEEGGITTVVDDLVRALAVWPCEGAIGAVPVFLEGLTLPGEDGAAGWLLDCALWADDDGSSSAVLGGEDVARRPTDIGTEDDEGLDENGGLNGHVERAGDAEASEWLRGGVPLTENHEAGHFLFGEHELFTAELAEGEILNVVLEGSVSW